MREIRGKTKYDLTMKHYHLNYIFYINYQLIF